MHVERTFTVPRPVEEVFAYLGDFTHTEAWDPGTVSTTRTSGDGGLGTTYANTSQFMGRTVDLSYETITYQPSTMVQFRGRNKQSTATDSMTFTPTTDGGTSVHYRADFEFHGLLKHLAPLVVRRKIDALADETVEQIVRTLTSR
ncbi:SRPBCC family protein [Nocardioides rubriscoriae]|uniref:SRPBCC family protein n=1 Tax=Nocardioides rubriscoriae TaxID=642762 RepID=UPI0011DF21A4|nr:SRPBCC family protein [Nocardioides rubriscoriae]